MASAATQEVRVIDPSGGANQSRVRAHNERLVLSLVRRHEELPKSEIARRSGLSPQTVSVIMRALEADGLLLRGEPQRGKVGQPSIPMRLNPDGVFSLGLKIGRRSADLVLVDFLGRERKTLSTSFDYPLPEKLLAFTNEGIDDLTNFLPSKTRGKISGIGVAMPFELWNWAEKVGAPQADMDVWRVVDFKAQLEAATTLPVLMQNDATSACSAELVFGRGAELTDFVYFFIGTFIGGGIVLNHSVYSGKTGNAGALGSMPMRDANGHSTQLIDHASVCTLEAMLTAKKIDCSPIWLSPEDWSVFGPVLDEWVELTARHLALAIVASCSLIDFEAAIIDGGFPAHVRSQLVAAADREVDKLDLQGIARPDVLEGMVGRTARALGGASLPLSARYLLDQNVLFKETQEVLSQQPFGIKSELKNP